MVKREQVTGEDKVALDVVRQQFAASEERRVAAALGPPLDRYEPWLGNGIVTVSKASECDVDRPPLPSKVADALTNEDGAVRVYDRGRVRRVWRGGLTQLVLVLNGMVAAVLAFDGAYLFVGRLTREGINLACLAFALVVACQASWVRHSYEG